MQPMQLVLGSFKLPVDLAIRNGEVCGALRFSGVFGTEIVQPFARGAKILVRLLGLRHLLAQRRQVGIFHEHIVAQEPSLNLATRQLGGCLRELFLGLAMLQLQTPTILGDRRHGFRLEVSHPLLELPTIVFSSMEMLSERAHQSRHVLDSRTDGARRHRHHELVRIRIRPRRRTVDRLSWKGREIDGNLRFLH